MPFFYYRGPFGSSWSPKLAALEIAALLLGIVQPILGINGLFMRRVECFTGMV